MTKQSVDLYFPNDYEPAQGDQPRSPVAGDYYWEIDLNEVHKATEDLYGETYIILRKKVPEYQVYTGESPSRFVDLETLNDALEIIHLMLRDGKHGAHIPPECQAKHEALCRLVENSSDGE